jgi:uncharacterized protein with HEPN domain
MLDAAREARDFAAGRSRGELSTDRLLALALTKLLEIIGEAASTMRNRLIHGYFDIDSNIVWDTVTSNLEPLIVALEDILADEGKV